MEILIALLGLGLTAWGVGYPIYRRWRDSQLYIQVSLNKGSDERPTVATVICRNPGRLTVHFHSTGAKKPKGALIQRDRPDAPPPAPWVSSEGGLAVGEELPSHFRLFNSDGSHLLRPGKLKIAVRYSHKRPHGRLRKATATTRIPE